jgi:hypothetical protein
MSKQELSRKRPFGPAHTKSVIAASSIRIRRSTTRHLASLESPAGKEKSDLCLYGLLAGVMLWTRLKHTSISS